MTTCKIKKWDSVSTDVNTLCQEIEAFLNLQEVKTVHTFNVGRHIIVIAIFENDKKEV